ncbi:MAG: mechanosensitive ion channel family protein [Fibrobacteria bacterium]|nr:mechanosensitive ion channel family protein [Fibrobacteria bacterium]
MYTYINDWLQGLGLSFTWANVLTRLFTFLITIIVCFIAYYLCKAIITKVIHKIIANTKTWWDDVLIEKKVFSRTAHLVPAIILYASIPIVFSGYEKGAQVAQSFVFSYVIIIVMLIIDSLLNVISKIYHSFDVSKEIPITGFIQVFKILLYAVAVLLILSVILHKSPTLLLSGLGAMTAILMLIFKDAILGLIGGIQLISNKMLSRGDWLEMPKDMTFLIRQLQPTEHGLPLQIYVFCKDKVWANYEAIQADIFDHILAIIPDFDLKVFQQPSGNDFNKAFIQD